MIVSVVDIPIIYYVLKVNLIFTKIIDWTHNWFVNQFRDRKYLTDYPIQSQVSLLSPNSYCLNCIGNILYIYIVPANIIYKIKVIYYEILYQIISISIQPQILCTEIFISKIYIYTIQNMPFTQSPKY